MIYIRYVMDSLHSSASFIVAAAAGVPNAAFIGHAGQHVPRAARGSRLWDPTAGGAMWFPVLDIYSQV